MNALKILLISVVSLLVGAASFCAVIGGLRSLPFSLLFLAFGWCYLIPVYFVVGFDWLLYARHRVPILWALLFVLAGAIFGAGLMALFGLELRDSELYGGLVVGGAMAGAVSNSLIVLLKDPSANGHQHQDHLSTSHS